MAEPATATSGTIWKQEGRVALVTFSNPSARNALTRAIFDSGLEIFRSLRRNQEIRAIVLRGDGEHFSGGGSLTRMIDQRSLPRHTQAEHVDACHAWILAMRECPQPIIAAVEGAAAGGGMALAMACDLIVAAEDAKMLMSHTKIGLSPDCGATHWLSRALPHQTALELMLDGAPIPIARLHQLGIVNKVTLKGMALTLSPTRDRGARSFVEPGRAEFLTTGMAWVVAFASAARCVLAGCPPDIGQSS